MLKLKRFDKNKKKLNSKYVIIASIMLIFMFSMFALYKSYALYKVQEEYDVIKSRIGEFNTENIILSYTVNGAKADINFPSKESNYTVNSVECSDGTTAGWDNTTWSLTNITPGASKKIKCNIDFKGPYKENILNGTDPVLSDNLVPVVLADDGTVTKADTYSEWYSYENKKWANAVILSDNTQTYNNGDIIPEDNIESYFVWIPKYSYEIFNLGTTDGYTEETPTESIAHEINIKFGLNNTNDSNANECTTPMTSGASGNCSVGNYMTHPAFISMNTNGLWVAKFETTGDIANLSVKPGVTSLRSQTVKSMFEAAYNYKRDNDSHMMKNTEWGALAYLSHSKYGINTEVRINNNSSFLTGYAAVDGTDQSSYPGTYGTDSSITLPYNTETGYKASTTGNITGVYDMSGGAYEYMSAYRKDTYGSSGFDATSLADYNTKYYDEYDANSGWSTHSKRILGDATGEMGPFYYYQDKDGNNRQHNNWYADGSDFVYSSYPCFFRGGGYSNGVLAGQFHFGIDIGGANRHVSFRLVLAK